LDITGVKYARGEGLMYLSMPVCRSDLK